MPERFKSFVGWGLSALSAMGLFYGMDVLLNHADWSEQAINNVFGPATKEWDFFGIHGKYNAPWVIENPPAAGAILAAGCAGGLWKGTDLIRGK